MKERRELKRTSGEQYKSQKKETNFIHREIKRSMKQSEKIKQSKLIASAQNKGNVSFWRASKARGGDTKKPNETEKSVEVSYKQLRATTDIGEMQNIQNSSTGYNEGS